MYKNKKQAIIEICLYTSMLILAMLFQYNVFGMDKNAATITASLLFLIGTIMLIAALNGLIKLVKGTTNPAFKDIKYDYKKGSILYDLHKLGFTDEIQFDLNETEIIIIVKATTHATRLIVSDLKSTIVKEATDGSKESFDYDATVGQKELYDKLYKIHNCIEDTPVANDIDAIDDAKAE